MAKSIPVPQQQQAQAIIERFNREVLGAGQVRYAARFKGAYLYLDRRNSSAGRWGPICRLKFTGDASAWELAIYKYSICNYDPEETWFPGYDRFNGSIESALSAGLEAYPPDWTPWSHAKT
jgi:hypothetical protein